MTEQALAGVRVLELARYIAGPYCGKLLAGFGAEVIKVEHPHTGDPARHWGPFPGDRPDLEASGMYLYLNTNKKSITVDLETATGQEIVQRLAEESDVLLEDFPPGTLQRLGLDYERLAQRNPRLILVSVTPFGQTGPWSRWKGDELILHAVSGLLHITGDPDREPLKNGGHHALYNTGIAAFGATLMALYMQQLTGEGQRVDLAGYEAMTYMLEPPRVTQASIRGEFRNRTGNRGSLLPAADGFVNFIPGPSRQWESIAEITGNPEFIERFGNNPQARQQNADELEAMLLPWLLDHSKLEFYHEGQKRGQNYGYVMSPQEMVESPQVQERGFFVEIEHPRVGRKLYPGAPYKLSRTPWQVGRAPLLGEHTEEVLCGRLGYTPQELVDLRRAGVI